MKSSAGASPLNKNVLVTRAVRKCDMRSHARRRGRRQPRFINLGVQDLHCPLRFKSVLAEAQSAFPSPPTACGLQQPPIQSRGNCPIIRTGEFVSATPPRLNAGIVKRRSAAATSNFPTCRRLRSAPRSACRCPERRRTGFGSGTEFW